ncbi:transcriptional regulator of RNA polII, SAGA, subunit-domain-containing protein [Syncephalis fuscata]|nr:transcriptional regulator of RNA polII, SAGA, subunit-domain-containing protein [Syncephalis fuscata]
MAPDGRRDTLAFKEKLNQEFLTGRLNREEFDHWATLYLPKDQVYLHNEFLLSTLFNALLETPPNDGGKGLKRKFDETDAEKTAVKGDDGTAATFDANGEQPAKKKESAADAKHRALKQAVRALSKTERERIKNLLKKESHPSSEPAAISAATSRVSFPPPLVKLAQNPESLPSFATEYMRALQAPLSSDAKGIPSGDALLGRMHAVAMEYGIHGIQQDAVRLMFSALEVHMKTIIEQCITKLRANRLFGIRILETSLTSTSVPPAISSVPSSGPLPVVDTLNGVDEEGNDDASGINAFAPTDISDKAIAIGEKRPLVRRNPSASTTIRPRDLSFVAQLSPHILVEAPLNIERLNSVILSNTRLEKELNQQTSKRFANLQDKEEAQEQAALDEFLDSILGIQYA